MLRSDIWSFCVVLYKALTGVLPFKGSKARAIMHEILHGDPAPLGSAVDDELARIVLSGLSKDPEERPRCMRELGGQLAHWLRTQGVLDDGCGAPLSPKWLVRGVDSSVPYAPAEAREMETAPSTLRSARSRRRYAVLLAALAFSLVLGTLAWADSAPESRPHVASPPLIAAAPPVIAAAPPVLAAAPPLPLESQTEASITVTISVPDQPASKPNPKPKASAKSRAPRPPQLPF